MHLKSQDIAVIKQALKIAQRCDQSGQAAYSYREVLAKLSDGDEQDDTGETFYADRDGFRYDYDDASEN